jgi:hypothetical protein
MKEIENLKQTIMKDYDRMTGDDKFKFACHPGVSCFNNCCGDVNIFLTPYDILRMKNRLGITSMEFLDKYTITPIDKNQLYPVVLFAMQDNEKKTCHFVTDKGCGLYEDRPWSCRMYPLGVASPKAEEDVPSDEFYFLMKEDVCNGFAEGKEWNVNEWKENQGIPEYEEFGNLFKEITLHDYFKRGMVLTPAKMEMFHMVCYNLDKFRTFLFGTSFFNRFSVEPELQKKMEDDDEELLRFGFRWLKFSLYGEDVLNVRPEAKRKVSEAKQK